MTLDHAAYLLRLTRRGLRLLERDDPPVSAPLRIAFRLARLRQDYEPLYWLAFELFSGPAKATLSGIQGEVIRHLDREAASQLHERTLSAFLATHAVILLDKDGAPVDSDFVDGSSIPEIEKSIPEGVAEADRIKYHQEELQHMHPATLERQLKRGLYWKAQQHRLILVRLASRLTDYLSRTEADLLAGIQDTGVLLRTEQYVDRRLEAFAPEAAQMLANAKRLLVAADAESLSLAATSCRRSLKAVADLVYPATGAVVRGGDGRDRVMSDDKWISRIWQFTSERITNEASRRLMGEEVETVGRKVDQLNDLASKGVHGQVSSFEAQQCVVRTYLVIADVLRLQDDTSGLGAVPIGEERRIADRDVSTQEGGHS